MLLQELEEKGLLGTGDATMKLPHWLSSNTCYLTISGSIAYGCADTNTDEASDFDTIGICIPPKDKLFPHLAGHIFGFDEPPKLVPGEKGVYEEHHIKDPSARGGKGREYDINVYSIVKMFSECTKGNPNLIDSLFTNRECILHCTQVGNIIRDNRKMFLTRKCWNTYKQYAYSQLHKMKGKTPVGKRKEQREKHGYDTKFAYNLIRLLNECDQILSEGDIDLMRNREQLKSVKRGEWTQIQVEEYCINKEKMLEVLYANTTLPALPDERRIKQVLLDCLEHHYGNLSKVIVVPNKAEDTIQQIKNILVNSGF